MIKPTCIDKKPPLLGIFIPLSHHHTAWYYLSGIITWIIIPCIWACGADEQSHYDAAYLLVTHVHENREHAFAEAVIQSALGREPLLAPYKNDIEQIINTYFASQEYKEMRIKAVMHYFTEQEIRDITEVLQNTSFYTATGVRVALVKKYEKVFDRLERIFINHIEQKLRNKF